VTKPSVYAVMTATIEVYVQPSNCQETFEQMFQAAQREAKDKLARINTHAGIRVVGEPEFKYATVREAK
jgi:hypothetical protein